VLQKPPEKSQNSARFLAGALPAQRQGKHACCGNLLKNLKILLVFWQENYLYKDKVNMRAVEAC
jgi:hypothetical protein